MSSKLKKIIALFALLSFSMIAVLGFVFIAYGQNMSASNGCPFGVMGATLCPQDIMAVAMHHLSVFQSFINVPVNFDITAFIVSLIIAPFAILGFFMSVSPVKLFYPARLFYDFPPDASIKRKIIRWLALHENSPADFLDA